MAIPDFLIVGAAKAGTTSLHHYLSQHPRISATKPKETFYFVRPEIERITGVGASYAPRPIPTGPEDYATRFVKDGPGVVRGESCVAYLYFPEAPARIKAQNPDCKIIIILRDPAERAFSNYLHHVRDGIEPLPFRAALDAGPKRVADGWWFGFDYLDSSRYGRQVRRYLGQFPRENLLFLWYDDLNTRPEFVLRKICDFVGVDPQERIVTSEKMNVSTLPRPRAARVLGGLKYIRPIARRVLPRAARAAIAGQVDRLSRYRPRLSPQDRAYVMAQLRDDLADLRDALAGEAGLPPWLGAP